MNEREKVLLAEHCIRALREQDRLAGLSNYQLVLEALEHVSSNHDIVLEMMNRLSPNWQDDVPD